MVTKYIQSERVTLNKMNRVIFVFIIHFLFSCNGSEVSSNSVDYFSQDDNYYNQYYDSYLSFYGESKLIKLSNVDQIRLSRINPISGYSSILTMETDSNTGYYSYDFKKNCKEGCDYSGYGNFTSEWLEESWNEIKKLSEMTLKGDINYKGKKPTKWLVEIESKNKSGYALYEVQHMFDKPIELQNLISLISEEVNIFSEEVYVCDCSN